jgi:outer membrane protein TolC
MATAAALLWALLPMWLCGCSPGSMPRWFTPEPWRMPPEPAERAVAAAERESPAGPLFMSVIEAVRVAFENNTSLRVRRLDPAIARTEIEFERSAFDPLLSAALGASGSREQNPGTFTSRSRGFDSSVELSQKLPPGTVWSLSYDWSQSDGLTSTVDHFGRVGLTVVQPLLRGFGRDANLTGIERAVRTYELSRFAFEQAAMDLATAVERAYWDLVQSQLDMVVQLELLTSARDRLGKNRKRIELGAKGVDEFDIVQDEAAVSSRRESLLRLENSIEVQKLRLVRLIHPKGVDAYWRRTLQTYVPYLDPDRLPAVPETAATLRTALTDRPEVKAARIGEAISELDLRKARNDLLPQLDLTAGWGYTGHGPSFARAGRTVLDGHYYDFDVSLQYSWSIGNRAAGSRHDRAELDKARSARTVEDVEQTVQSDVRIALQQLDNAARRYRQALENQALQRRKLDLARAAYEAGKPGFTLFFLIQFEDDLRNAAFLLNSTIVEYLKALTDLRRAEGSILRVRGLKLD